MANVYIQVPDDQATEICDTIRKKLFIRETIKSGEVSGWVNKMLGVAYGFTCEKVVE